MNRQLIEHVPDWGRTNKNEPKTGQGGKTKNVLKMTMRIVANLETTFCDSCT